MCPARQVPEIILNEYSINTSTSDCLCLSSDGLLVTQPFIFGAWSHDIPYKVGGSIVFSEVHAASGLDPDWWQFVAIIGEFQVFESIL
jgi:hypothetical protein